MAYQGIRIKKTKDGSETKNTSDFSIFVESVPFRLIGDAKDLYSNDWHDENGLDEYVPDVIPIKSYDIEIGFIYRGKYEDASTTIKSFLDYLIGIDGSGASMYIYDPYNNIGRGGIRYKSASDNVEIIGDDDNEKIVKFSVTFQVNDPITNVVL